MTTKTKTRKATKTVKKTDSNPSKKVEKTSKIKVGNKTKELLANSVPVVSSITSDAPEFKESSTSTVTSIPPDTLITNTDKDSKSEKVTKSKKTAPPEIKPFSEKVFEIVGNGVKFLGNQITADSGLKIQRIGANVFKFSYPNPDLNSTEKIVSEEHSFSDAESNMLEGQLQLYEKGLGNRKNVTNITNTSNIADIIKQQEQKVYSKVEQMESYGETILNGIMSVPNVKVQGRTIPKLMIENMLKMESKQYTYEIKQGITGKYFIEMTEGKSTVRIPKNELEFLPVH